MSVQVRPFRPADLEPVVGLWNRCLGKDPIRLERFWRLFLLDPNFAPEGALVAEAEGQVVGYLQAIYRKTLPGYLVDGPSTGWITAFFVAPEFRRQGIGRRLVTAGVEFLLSNGCEAANCNGYAPYYAFPGVDHEYADAPFLFLPSLGFETLSEAVAMRLALTGIRMPEEVRHRRATLSTERIAVRWSQLADTLPLIAFAEAHFPDWVSGIVDGLQRDNRDIMVAIREGEVLGYTQWQNTQTDPPTGAPGRFGPFGVHPEMRSRGLGAVIFWTLAESVAAAGCRELWFGWAGGRNLSFYERVGCQVTRRFRLFRLPLP